MTKKSPAFVGTWRITALDTWDADYFDMDVPAQITIQKDLTGHFQFGLVQGEIDGRMETERGIPRLAFSWSGFDENNPISGRGWLQVISDKTEGHIYIHGGDESGLTAER